MKWKGPGNRIVEGRINSENSTHWIVPLYKDFTAFGRIFPHGATYSLSKKRYTLLNPNTKDS